MTGHCHWVFVWTGACYWHGVGGLKFNSPSPPAGLLPIYFIHGPPGRRRTSATWGLAWLDKRGGAGADQPTPGFAPGIGHRRTTHTEPQSPPPRTAKTASRQLEREGPMGPCLCRRRPRGRPTVGRPSRNSLWRGGWWCLDACPLSHARSSRSVPVPGTEEGDRHALPPARPAGRGQSGGASSHRDAVVHRAHVTIHSKPAPSSAADDRPTADERRRRRGGEGW